MDWYFAEANQRLGPVSDSEFKAFQASGRIGPATLVWRSGMAEWQPLSAVDGAASAFSSPDGGFCTECGRAAGAGELLAYGDSRICATCKDAFFQRVREQGVAASRGKGNYHFAGFWIRFLARFIDGLIQEVVYLPIGTICLRYAGLSGRGLHQPPDGAEALRIFAGFGAFVLVEMLLNALYEGWFISHRGGTPGKLILGLQVIRPGGERVSFGRAVGRYFAFLLSYAIVWIGCIIAGFDSEKRSLHDRICDTRVIYQRG
jgi:uncharacterized RDD family membrane protein YckC